MAYEFYGPKMHAVLKVNALLGLPATGKEQDWEFEFSSPSRVLEILDVLIHGNFDEDCQGALALLLIASMEESDLIEVKEKKCVTDWFEANEKIRKQMQFYWMHLQRATNQELMLEILGEN